MSGREAAAKKVVVVGGGIAGLATAVQLERQAHEAGTAVDVTVVEGSDRLGGNIRTEKTGGYTIEHGPNGFLDNVPATAALVEHLGLGDRIVRADDRAAVRYLYRHGALHRLPAGPISFLRSPILSLRGRLRLFLEPLMPRAQGDETIYEFASRRIGDEAARILVGSMVSGVFAGDIEELSLPAAFPKMRAMESEHGSLVRAMVAKMLRRRAAKKAATRGEEVAEDTRPGGPAEPGGTLTSWVGGLEELVRSAASKLRTPPETGWRVAELARRSGSDGWTLRSEDGPSGKPQSLRADAVVLTLPSRHVASLLSKIDAELGELTAGIGAAAIVVVALGFDPHHLRRPLDGFGFLIPRGEGPRILGCLWDSSIFPGCRAPQGKALVRAMIGGAHDRGICDLSDDEITTIVRRDLETTLGLPANAETDVLRVYRYPAGICQYQVGHLDRLDAIHLRLEDQPGLWLGGSSYYGIAMNACIAKAEAQAGEILAALSGS